MGRAKWLAAAALAVLVGCQSAEQLKVPPAPADGQPLAFRDAVLRARSLATAATEAFYVDHWSDVEAAAAGLEVTAQALPKAQDVPAARVPSLPGQATALQQEAQLLRTAAQQKDEKKINEALQRIHLRVRELRPE